MKRMSFGIIIVLCLICNLAAADPLLLKDDIQNTVSYFSPEDPSINVFSYSYCFPRISENEEAAYRITAFYLDKAEMLESEIPYIAESHEFSEEPLSIHVSYTVTCNNDLYFSVVVKQETVIGNNTRTIFEGNTFSRKYPKAKNLCNLANLLGILDPEENDAKIISHQKDRIRPPIYHIILDEVQNHPDRYSLLDDFSEQDLANYFLPENDFYLNENGDPVFYVEPGIITDETDGYLFFTIPIEEIKDEM